ncbi:MAG: hypothetical protein Q9187_002452 [Circinaria calcarea]
MQSFLFSVVALLCALKANAQLASVTSISPSQESALVEDVENYVSTLVNDPVVSQLATAIPTSLLPVLGSVAEQFADETVALSIAGNPTALAAGVSSLVNIVNSAVATQPFYTDLLAFETRVAGELQSIAAENLGVATATGTASSGFVSGPSSMITASPNATAIVSPSLTSSSTISGFTGAAMPMVKGGVQAVMGAAAAAAGVMGMVAVL